ncbi:MULTISPECIES: acyltransferase [Metabacillus]|uniref:Acyltransferase n=2 Tax=Metabacillus TaxID=2675233 RepID=A0A179T3D7_9BACI|nr:MULTISPECIES: acyltransferase [Metabacillus]OAS88194.1 hypothetical protein A6K24_17620 [Metabacillus litoralis]QNF27375.1 acyltransferase [Metabacillus sp. KUDC1714]
MIKKVINHLSWRYNTTVIKLKKMHFRLNYGERVDLPPDLLFRKGFKLLVEKEGRFKIGNGCFFNFNCTITCFGDTTIGNDCIFGENVKFYDHNHRFSDTEVLIRNQGYKVGSIKIGNNCWIGSNVTILKDITIGDNVVIGANCLINKSIPSNTIVKPKNELIFEEKRL